VNNRSDQPPRDFVKDLLGELHNPTLVFETLTAEQKMGLAIAKVVEMLDDMQNHGCTKLQKLERKVDVIIKATTLIVGLAGFLYVVILIAQAASAAG